MINSLSTAGKNIISKIHLKDEFDVILSNLYLSTIPRLLVIVCIAHFFDTVRKSFLNQIFLLGSKSVTIVVDVFLSCFLSGAGSVRCYSCLRLVIDEVKKQRPSLDVQLIKLHHDN